MEPECRAASRQQEARSLDPPEAGRASKLLGQNGMKHPFNLRTSRLLVSFCRGSGGEAGVSGSCLDVPVCFSQLPLRKYVGLF